MLSCTALFDALAGYIRDTYLFQGKIDFFITKLLPFSETIHRAFILFYIITHVMDVCNFSHSVKFYSGKLIVFVTQLFTLLATYR